LVEHISPDHIDTRSYVLRRNELQTCFRSEHLVNDPVVKAPRLLSASRLWGLKAIPASIFHLRLIAKDVADWKAKAQIIAVFHTNAGHVTLHDQAYNADRTVSTGNPYKELVADLMKRGVQVELCGATATVHHWGNEDLLPGIKVNTDAMSRMSQLVQDGFVQITEWD